MKMAEVRRKRTIVNRIPFKDLEEWVNEPLEDDVQCLEFDERPRLRLSDDQVWAQIYKMTGINNPSSYQQIVPNRRLPERM